VAAELFGVVTGGVAEHLVHAAVVHVPDESIDQQHDAFAGCEAVLVSRKWALESSVLEDAIADTLEHLVCVRLGEKGVEILVDRHELLGEMSSETLYLAPISPA
jgi:hypothetical protein